MKEAAHRRVANPPPKPLLLFDGDCHFCRRWVERWREITRGRVDYASSQEAGARFPEIPARNFESAVQFVEPDGTISSGADAVFRSLGYGRGGKWLQRGYQGVPGFSAVTEFAYAIVAKNRTLASAATRALWGNDVRRPTYATTRHVFLRMLGLIYLIAFVSLWTQVDGLIGSEGVAPVARYLEAARDLLGAQAPSALPTLCWLNASDSFLHLLCGAGVASSLLLMAGLLPAVSLGLLFGLYLSLTIAGQTFFSFQWDVLLLEAGFLAIFLAPWRWRMSTRTADPVPALGLFLLKLLLFKLMFLSGVVKLTSGDASWWDLTALSFHYETQPLPTVLGWWAHQGPAWLKQISTAGVLVIEIAVPFLIWTPRRLRLLACALLVALQIAIALTGNYAFFNLLTITLCLLLLDDQTWRALRVQRVAAPNEQHSWSVTARRGATIAIIVVTLPIDAWHIYNAFKPEAKPPLLIAALDSAVARYRIVNSYGLFRVMTKARPEIIIEGSADGIDWLPYEMRWKPGELQQAPRWVAPHQPRLDWQMWFAALGDYRRNRWLDGLAIGLLRNNPAVIGLLGRNPFGEKPPRYVRAIVYEYNFTTPEKRRATRNWWKRGEPKEFFPAFSLRE